MQDKQTETVGFFSSVASLFLNIIDKFPNSRDFLNDSDKLGEKLIEMFIEKNIVKIPETEDFLKVSLDENVDSAMRLCACLKILNESMKQYALCKIARDEDICILHRQYAIKNIIDVKVKDNILLLICNNSKICIRYRLLSLFLFDNKYLFENACSNLFKHKIKFSCEKCNYEKLIIIILSHIKNTILKDIILLDILNDTLCDQCCKDQLEKLISNTDIINFLN